MINDNNQKGISVDVNTLPKEHCNNCNSSHFNQVFEIRRLSFLNPQNPTGQTAFIPVMIYVCSSCGETFNEGKSGLKKV